MKKIFLLSSVILVLFFACKKEETPPAVEENNSIMPSNFNVEMSDAISNESTGKTNGDTLTGEDIYETMRFFIKIGESSAETVEAIMRAVATHGINRPMDITFAGDDGRSKHLVVTENATYEGVNYKYKLNVEDSGKKALQMFWDNAPVKGVAIMSFYDMDHNEHAALKGVLYKVEYSETEANYDARMIVTLYNLPLNSNDPGSINNMKMFVGKKGDIIDVYGNSNHPNIKLIDPAFTGGRNYAFVGRANNKLNIAVAKVGLPPSSVTANGNLFTTYAIDSVIRAEVKAAYPGATDEDIDPYLVNTAMPGYFSVDGFIGCGATLPSVTGFTSEFADLSQLYPYIPNDIRTLTIEFQQ